MWRRFVISLGFLTVVLTGCDPQVLIARPQAGDYEVVALVAD
jgi:hypothetical protein